MDAKSNAKMIQRTMLRLLPVQVLFAIIVTINGIVSTYFASNYVGVDAMSAVGLYGPINMLIGACSTVLVGGAAFLAGKYVGQNDHAKVKNIFTLDIVLSVALSIIFTLLLLVMGIFSLTSFFTRDEVIQPIFNIYLIGNAVGILPFIIGNQLTIFLSMENKQRLSVIASVGYIVANLILNVLFVQKLHMEALGLALASALGMWVFCFIEAIYFILGKSYYKYDYKSLDLTEFKNIVSCGFPGAETNIYQTLRGIAVNKMLLAFVGSAGVSAFAAANNLMGLFWAIPAGMIAVSRLLISVATGEEDRQTLIDVMRTMFYRYIPIMMVFVVGIIACAEPFTKLFFKDPSAPVYGYTVMGFRILPLCMCFSILCMHYVCYAHALEKHVILHIMTALDGVICVVAFTALLIKPLGMASVYIANVLNGVVVTLTFVIYSITQIKRIPRNMADVMAMPDDFGASDDERMDISVKSIEEVTSVAEQVQEFCKKRGVDKRRSYLAGLSMEEMAGNIVEHGFTKDKKTHSVDIRVVHKDDDVILRLKDDCVPFDPRERQKITENDDPTKNMGIRMIFKVASDVQYQNILGLNFLTIKV
ncbi:MATE family efflux transporter [Butyrivibrio proteoclasticus]|uniref:MATE family efflux transporter n=1 Tax=Butyrivibrio proteoclasticus TaxID=43305 RepID=UPI00047D9E10|nr:MATE family efflux transporter [Butyrivibrio proteoclasticus]